MTLTGSCARWPREARADVAAAGEDQSLVGLLQAAEFAHHRADVLRRGDEEDLVVGLDDGVALRLDGAIVPVDGGDPVSTCGMCS
jgi:hypothetical protein